MAKNYYTDINLNNNKIQNGAFEVVSSLPTTNLFVGRKVCYGGKDYIYSGTTWTNDATTLEGIGINDILPKLNTPRGNLGNPSVFEAALINSQFTNKLWFYPSAAFLFERSTDDITYTEDSTVSPLSLVSGNSNSNIAIPKGSCLRMTITSQGYVYLNMLYLYYSMTGEAMFIKIEKYNSLNAIWTTVMDYTNGQASWPNHISVRHATIPFYNVSTASHYSKVRVTIKVNSDTSGGVYPNHFLYGMEWWGGYPTGQRTIYSWDNIKNVYFPASVISNETINCDINNIEPTQTGAAVVKTSSWWRQYKVQSINFIWSKLKGLLSTNGRVLLNKMQNRAPYINGSSIIGSETDTVIDWRAGANITITPGTVAGGLYPITIAATGGSGGSQVQVDFNITDSADVRYILNKPIDNRTISARISALVNKRFQVNPGTAAGNYNEGIRIGNASNSYSLIAFGCDASTDTGLNSDGNQWNVFKSSTGDFGIIPNSSNWSDGLRLVKNGDAYWRGSKILLEGSSSSNTVIILDPTIVAHHLTDKYYQLPIGQYNTNTDFDIALDETDNRYIELSVQMNKVDVSKLNFSFAPANSGEVYIDKNYTDITTTSGTCMIHFLCRFIEGNWFVSNQVFEM